MVWYGLFGSGEGMEWAGDGMDMSREDRVIFFLMEFFFKVDNYRYKSVAS